METQVIGVISSTLSVSIVTIGAAYGISRLARAAVEGMARQPEAADKIQTAMVIAAGLIEGIAFIAAIICLIGLFQ